MVPCCAPTFTTPGLAIWYSRVKVCGKGWAVCVLVASCRDWLVAVRHSHWAASHQQSFGIGNRCPAWLLPARYQRIGHGNPFPGCADAANPAGCLVRKDDQRDDRQEKIAAAPIRLLLPAFCSSALPLFNQLPLLSRSLYGVSGVIEGRAVPG